MANDAIDHALAEAQFGWHAVDEQTLGLQRQLNFNHNRGYEGLVESGRRYGLEREWNKATLPNIPQNISESSSETATPMESPDEINVNGTAVNPEDTASHGVAS